MKMMTMTIQERRLSWQFRHSLRRGLAFPSNAKGDLACMDDGEEYDDDGAKKNEGFPGNFGIASGVALPFLPMPKGI